MKKRVLLKLKDNDQKRIILNLHDHNLQIKSIIYGSGQRGGKDKIFKEGVSLTEYLYFLALLFSVTS